LLLFSIVKFDTTVECGFRLMASDFLLRAQEKVTKEKGTLFLGYFLWGEQQEVTRRLKAKQFSNN